MMQLVQHVRSSNFQIGMLLMHVASLNILELSQKQMTMLYFKLQKNSSAYLPHAISQINNL
jgi:hypothetical protein